MWEVWLDDDRGLGEETRAERLARICQLPNRAHNQKCIDAGLVPGFTSAGDPPIVTYGPDVVGPHGTLMPFPAPFLPGSTGVPAPGTSSTGAGSGGGDSGSGIAGMFSSLPSWAWIAIAAGGAFLLLKRR